MNHPLDKYQAALRLLSCGAQDAGFLNVPICNWSSVIDAARGAY